MKRVFACVLAVMMLLSLTACGGNDNGDQTGTTTTTTESTTTTEGTTTTEEPTTTTTEESTTTTEVTTTTEEPTTTTVTTTTKKPTTTKKVTTTTTKKTTKKTTTTTKKPTTTPTTTTKKPTTTTTTTKKTTTTTTTTVTTTTTKKPELLYHAVWDASHYPPDTCEISEDLPLSYDLVMGKMRFESSISDNRDYAYLEDYDDMWFTMYYKVPEKDMLEYIRQYFVFSDQQFEEMKKQEYLDWSGGDVPYKDGYFYLAGELGYGSEPYTYHWLTSYEDDKKGVIKINFAFADDGEFDKDGNVIWHEYVEEDDKDLTHYVVEYVYTGKSDLNIEQVYIDYEKEYGEEFEGEGYTYWRFVSNSQELLDSMRIRSITEIKD